MARDFIILECTEAKAEGKPVSRYISTRNKKSPNTPTRLEKVKYNPFLRRRTSRPPYRLPQGQPQHASPSRGHRLGCHRLEKP
ncbi:MAG: 50S ribosomal protein L33 [Proteobacteria bacterium]|nr:50S ribosomal protein L33 [Pseudomonadota bacterium]